LSLPQDPVQPTISTRALTRAVILLLAVWNAFAGLVLLAIHGASSGSLGAGVEDEAGQRLVGAHLLVLVPAYVLIAWRPERYRGFLWLPYVAQTAVVLVLAYNLVSGDTDIGDGILSLLVGAFFLATLAFLWITEQRTSARLRMEMEEESARRRAAGEGGEAE
jgi:hypothetical protein